jgi:hypothetical protein
VKNLTESESVAVWDLALEKHVAEAIKVKVLVLAVLPRLDLRVVRCHYKEDCQKWVLLHASLE